MKVKIFLLSLCMTLLAATSALAIPTTITIRVKAKDGKFLAHAGGALITIKDVHTGELLAKGLTTGDSGDTNRIMKSRASRGVPLSDGSTAKFTTTIDIDEPRFIEVTAYGPMAKLQAANKISVTQWIVPGKHITGGDAWMMELPGFVVDVHSLPMDIKAKEFPHPVKVEATIRMMCGCPITSGGVWDADKIEVAALLKRNGQRIGVLPMKYAGSPSQFDGTWNVPETGIYQATVYAYDPANGNTGVDSVTFIVRQ